MSDYNYVSAKLGSITGPTKSKSKELYDAAKAAGHEIWYMWGKGTSSEHATGRALDLMVRNEAAGDWIRNYIWKNRQRLRLQHVIWEQHITSTVTQPGVRRKMADRGSVTENHYDHVHVLFFEGTYQKPGSENDSVDPAPDKKKTNEEVAREVIAGKWGNGHTRTQRLYGAGYNPNEIQRLVNKMLDGDKVEAKKKTVSQLAAEVIDGKWGTDADRVARLTKAGYNASTVQKEVNRLLLGNNHAKKSVHQLAAEVMQGKWGNGEVRVQRLTRAGYNARAVQKEVNRRLR